MTTGFEGLVDEIVIYNSALPSDTISLHYALTDSGKDYCYEVAGGASTIATVFFNIRGCTFDFNGEAVGISAGECSSGDAGGYFYCDDEKNAWITQEEGYGCSLGETEYTLGEEFCCPPGMFCNETNGKFNRKNGKIWKY